MKALFTVGALISMLLVGGVVGCGLGSPMRIYVLGRSLPQVVGTQLETEFPVVEMKTVTVPAYLDSTDILRRLGTNEVVASPSGRWGERLSVGITQALTQDLSRQLPNVAIVTASNAKPAGRILVDIDRYEIGGDGTCLLTARWRVIAEDGQTTLERQHGVFQNTSASADDAGVAATMTGLINQLAEQIALSVRHAVMIRAN